VLAHTSVAWEKEGNSESHRLIVAGDRQMAIDLIEKAIVAGARRCKVDPGKLYS